MPWYLWVILVLCGFVYLSRERYKQNREMMQHRDAVLSEGLESEALKKEDAKQEEVETETVKKESYWVGQTQAELIASLGEPVVVDLKPLKSKRREVWKYEQTGKNRFALKLTLEDGIVVRWDRK